MKSPLLNPQAGQYIDNRTQTIGIRTNAIHTVLDLHSSPTAVVAAIFRDRDVKCYDVSVIVDIHAHLPRPLRSMASVNEVAAVVAEMVALGRRAGIDRQVILGLDIGLEANDALRELVGRFPETLVAFMRGSFIDPDGPAILERCVREFGFKGLKLHEEEQHPLAGLLGGGALFRKAGELGGLRELRRAIQGGLVVDDGPNVERPRSYQSCGRIVELSEDLRGSYAIGDIIACSGGGFAAHAEYDYAPKDTIAKVPDGVTPEEAATTNVALTGLHALRRARLQAGELIGVIGLGMVGQFILQLAAAWGGRAIGTDLYPLRLEKARELGAVLTYGNP